MDPNWDDSQPIYRQLRDRVVAMILEGVLKEGDPLPSVRAVAAEFRLNPLTVLKGYQQLVDEQLVEKRRGRGMFVNAGARQALMKDERQYFLESEWPKIYATIQRLGLTTDAVLAAAAGLLDGRLDAEAWRVQLIEPPVPLAVDPAATHADGAAEPRRPRSREGTKEAMLIAMLRRPEGATIAQVIEATGWQKHTVRGAISGALKKKQGLEVTSEKGTSGERVYRITGS